MRNYLPLFLKLPERKKNLARDGEGKFIAARVFGGKRGPRRAKTERN